MLIIDSLCCFLYFKRMNHYSQGNEDANCDWQECSSAFNFNTLTYNMGRTIQQNNVTLWQGNGKTMRIPNTCTHTHLFTCILIRICGEGERERLVKLSKLRSNRIKHSCKFFNVCRSLSVFCHTHMHVAIYLCETLLSLPFQRRVSDILPVLLNWIGK